MSSLTRTQQSTLKMIAGGITHVKPDNKTAKALGKEGLVYYQPPFGWLLTNDGHAVYRTLPKA